jgi:hypothetical protein
MAHFCPYGQRTVNWNHTPITVNLRAHYYPFCEDKLTWKDLWLLRGGTLLAYKEYHFVYLLLTVYM